jgi:hypothetical protein
MLSLLQHRLAEPLLEPDRAESRLAGRNQRALAEFGPEVPRVWVHDYLAQVVARGEALTDQLVKRILILHSAIKQNVAQTAAAPRSTVARQTASIDVCDNPMKDR